jgi:hypothetical protein
MYLFFLFLPFLHLFLVMARLGGGQLYRLSVFAPFKKNWCATERDDELGMSALAVYAMTVNSFCLTHT